MVEPIELADAKQQLRVLSDDENASIQNAIVDARGWIESYTGLILTRREVVEVLPCFDGMLSTWPIVSIDAVTYLDTSQQEVVFPEQDYFAQIARRPARLSSKLWPAIYNGSTVEVTMTAGFASPEAINAFSPNIMRAMRLLVAGFYADRETGGLAGDVEIAAKRLCRPFKSWRV
ncbi:head-tail connector protein [Sphingobium sp. Cam5-1]|uniref:head-tail connector protein n=1 Tax=Sphingobium sp. Cam5-1 TaxID=2789327 RepID=UPI0018AD1119|nr:phage head-tail connector protein [Sphingobium sp. Cam5-1]QPI73928.1 phage head-tail connector protein [Sphingobium sp. Cam5-1]